MAYLLPSFIDNSVDVKGTALENAGRVKYPNEIWSSCLNVDGSQVLTASDLTDITIVDYDAEGVMSINGNNIEITAGECYYLELSNGSKYRFSERGGDVLHDISGNRFELAIANSSVNNWVLSPLSYPQNNSKGLSFGAVNHQVLINCEFLNGTNGFTTISPVVFNVNNANQAVISRSGGSVLGFPLQSCLESGKSYTITVDIDSLSNNFSIYLGGTGSEVGTTAAGVQIFTATAIGTDLFFGPTGAVNATCIINYIKIEEADESVYYIPASEIDPAKDVEGNDLQVLGTDTGLNGCESQYLSPHTYELIQAGASLAPNFIFDTGGSVLWGYDDIESNVQDLDFMFSDVNTNTPVKFNTTTYSEALTGADLDEALLYFNT